MIRAGVIILLGTLVGSLLIHVVMLLNLIRRVPPGRLALREFLSVLLLWVNSKLYTALLVEASIQPTSIDRMLYFLQKILVCFCAVGLVLVIIGLIWS